MGRAHKFRDDEHEHEHVTCYGCGRDDIHVINRHDRRIYELHSYPDLPGQPCSKVGYNVRDDAPRPKQSSK